MRKLVVPLAIAASSLVSSTASAQVPAPSPVTGNITLASEYRFRGIDQTAGKPAIQGGFDYSHASGVYLGNWNSNISQGAGFPGGNIEMDFYGGWKKAFGDFGVDVGAIYYYYPGTDASFLGAANPHSGKTNDSNVHNTEFYIGGSWKWLSVKWFHALSDYFSIPDTSGTNYYDFAATYDMGGGWGLVGHVGLLKAQGYTELNYTDYKLGVTKDITGWVLGAAYVDTTAKGNCPFDATSSPYCFSNNIGQAPRDAGRGTIVLSVGKTF
jgi:uncharacterized protein (TIGR02001 family)